MKCIDKVYYKTRGDAYAASRTMYQNNRRVKLNIYECKYCGGYHITHKRPERWNERLASRHRYNFKDVSE